MAAYETDEVSIELPDGWAEHEVPEAARVWLSPGGAAELWLSLAVFTPGPDGHPTQVVSHKPGLPLRPSSAEFRSDFAPPIGDVVVDLRPVVQDVFAGNVAFIEERPGGRASRRDEAASDADGVHWRSARWEGTTKTPVTFVRVQATDALFRGHAIVATARFLLFDPARADLLSHAPRVLESLKVLPAFLRVEPHENSSIDESRLYPLLVPASYLARPSDAPEVGHGLHRVFALDHDGVASVLVPAELTRRGLDLEAAVTRAMSNLFDRMRSGAIRLSNAGETAGCRFLAFHSDWLAASMLLEAGLRQNAVKLLGGDRILACAATRTDLLVFRADDRLARDEVQSLARALAKEDSKPLSTGLFEVTESGPRPIID